MFHCRKEQGDLEIVSAIQLPENSTNEKNDPTIVHMASCKSKRIQLSTRESRPQHSLYLYDAGSLNPLFRETYPFTCL